MKCHVVIQIVGDFQNVFLGDNKLTRLDSYVFQSMLEILYKANLNFHGILTLNSSNHSYRLNHRA